MNKSLIVAASLAVAAGAQAQGLVNFANSASAATKISINSTPGSAVVGLTPATANAYYYALFYSATATTVLGSSASVIPTSTTVGSYVTSDNNWTYVTTTGSSATAGRLTAVIPTVPGLGGGSSAQFVVIGWSANIGSTVASLAAYLAAPSLISGNYGYVGESVVSGALQAGDGATILTPAIFSGVAPAVQGFTLGAVAPAPEPTTIALAGLGGLSLLAFRRKNA
jgi:hypothetical protein